MIRSLIATGVLLAGTSIASAGEGADILTEALYTGDFAAAQSELGPLVDAGDTEAALGAGMLTIVDGIETFLQAMHRHGLSSPETGMLGMMFGIPVDSSTPARTDVEPLDYETLRSILADLVTAMDEGRELLVAAGESGDYVIPIDVLAIHIDSDSDPTTQGSTLGELMAVNFGVDPADLLAPSGKAQSKGEALSFVVGFDRADAYWLAGYSQIIATQADFFLAHDFEEMFNASFHRIFPQAGLPMQDYAAGGVLMMDPASDAAIADAIAFVHTFNFPVVDRERFAGVLERLKAVTAHSRQNWEAILAETDDNRELVPSPTQTSLVPDVAVTQEVVDAWMATLDSVDQILAGDLLIPHWRFRQGFDLTAYFETATRTDAVMILTGYGALPFLKDGPIADAESFGEGMAVFGDNFPGFALWFN
jgi:hypothetical protein